MSQNEMRNVLYLFGQLSEADIDWFGTNGELKNVPAGSELIRSGQEIGAVFVLLEGKVKVVTGAGEVAQMGSGEIMGEMSLIDSRPPSATISTVMQSRVLRIPRRALDPKLVKDPAFAARFFRGIAISLSDRLRQAHARLDEKRAGAKPADDEDELSPELLDTIHLAGARFSRLLEKTTRK